MTDKPHIMIVSARFYPEIAEELERGAVATLDAAGATHRLFQVPGAFEIPAAIQMAIRSVEFSIDLRRYDGFVALGCVIRGETSHYDHVCAETIRTLQDLVCRHTLALGMGVLTVENEKQARARARVDGKNRGGEAAKVCLAMLDVKRHFKLYPRRDSR
jgi:6,7-dimethyl-8-ribityllumazine synthase